VGVGEVDVGRGDLVELLPLARHQLRHIDDVQDGAPTDRSPHPGEGPAEISNADYGNT
jgi:hypothetical protein